MNKFIPIQHEIYAVYEVFNEKDFAMTTYKTPVIGFGITEYEYLDPINSIDFDDLIPIVITPEGKVQDAHSDYINGSKFKFLESPLFATQNRSIC